MKIYLAGPLFTAAERLFNPQLKDLLTEADHELWLPQEDEPRDSSAAEIFQRNLEGIQWSDAVIANLDGADSDSGTCWECGYSFAVKPVVVFRTDFRAGEGPGLSPCNLMPWEAATERLNLPSGTAEQVAERIVAILIPANLARKFREAQQLQEKALTPTD